jgi:large subunit ribosomal protein L32e
MTAFLRRIYNRYHKLGKKKGKNRVWRKPKGRDNKLRDKRRGYGPTVSIGYRQKESERGKALVIRNVAELGKISKGQEIVLGKIGKKKKIELLRLAGEKGILILNLNVKKFLKKTAKEGNKK